MKKMLFLLLLLLFEAGSSILPAQINCLIRGDLSRMKVDKVQLVDATVDYRHHGVEIPVADSKFTHTITLDHNLVYQLVFYLREPHAWYFVPVVIENAELDVQVFPDRSYHVLGGKLNNEYQRYLADLKARQLRRNDTFLHNWFYGYEDELYYFLLVERLQQYRQNYEQPDSALISAFDKMAVKYKEHPYTEFGRNLLQGFSSIKVGGQYCNFEAPDMDGRKHKLSDLVKGKYAIIDLWASWCSPCRKKAKRMIPVYERFKDKGFTVVGVAREFKDTKKLQLALKQDKYPWMQLVELDDSLQIWNKYMLGNAGGGVFFVDKDGKILAINPTAEEVEAILQERLLTDD